MAKKFHEKALPLIRRIARVGSILSVSLILFIFIGELVSEPSTEPLRLTLRETFMTIAFFVLFIGLPLSWKWELLGSILILGGLIVFYMLDYIFSGTLPQGPWFFILASPGGLFL